MTEFQKTILEKLLGYLSRAEETSTLEDIKAFLSENNFFQPNNVRRINLNLRSPQSEPGRTLYLLETVGLVCHNRFNKGYGLSAEGRTLANGPILQTIELIESRTEQRRDFKIRLCHQALQVLSQNDQGVNLEIVHERIRGAGYLPDWANINQLAPRSPLWHADLRHFLFMAKSANLITRTETTWNITEQGKVLIELSPQELFKQVRRSFMEHSRAQRLNMNPIEALCELTNTRGWCAEEFCGTCGGSMMYRAAFIEILSGGHPHRENWPLRRENPAQGDIPNHLTLTQLSDFMRLLSTVNMSRWRNSDCIKVAFRLCERSIRAVASEGQAEMVRRRVNR